MVTTIPSRFYHAAPLPEIDPAENMNANNPNTTQTNNGFREDHFRPGSENHGVCI
jgi:hypothetical protein